MINYKKVKAALLKIKLQQSSFVLLCALLLGLSNSSIAQEVEETTQFERGNKIIFTDDFSKDAMGDFPAKWSSTQGGEIKKISGISEKLLSIPAGSIVNLPLKKPLPENFTLEYDLIIPAELSTCGAAMVFGSKLEKADFILTQRNGIAFTVVHTDRKGFGKRLLYGNDKMDIKLQKVDYDAPLNEKIHIGIMVNGTRIRYYLNETKMIDLPGKFLAEFRKNIYFNTLTNGWAETKTSYFYVTNVVLAETGIDRRSQVVKDLLKYGYVSTHVIQFATNSDKLTKESLTIIKEIADALQEDKSIKLLITGHTDNVGKAESNLVLSKKRAASVKKQLVAYGIAATRLTTDGKGDTVPANDNDTEDQRMMNRRVEFKKL